VGAIQYKGEEKIIGREKTKRRKNNEIPAGGA
jgi:hypothetical protein